jgi:hypothetical protein
MRVPLVRGEREKPFRKELGRTDGPDWAGWPRLLGPTPFLFSFLLFFFVFSFSL